MLWRRSGACLMGGRAVTSVIAASLAWALLAAGIVPAPAVAADDERGPAPMSAPAAKSKGTIALTFDDGYAAARCLEIADILSQYGVPATWFPNGMYVRSAPAVWRKIGRRFPIANHTYSHPSLPTLSSREIERQIVRNQRLIEQVTGRPMLRLLRPPFGATDKRVERIARRLGYDVVLWGLSSADTSPNGTDRGIAKRALRGRDGDSILMHCGPAVTPRILPIVIARYACKGYRFATLDELLAGADGVAARVECPAPPLPSKKGRPSRRQGNADATRDERSDGQARMAIPTGASAARAIDVRLPSEPMSAEDRAAIDAQVAAILEAQPDVPAIYLGVWDPQRGSYRQAYGLADVEAGRAAGVDDHVRIGSISKTFMAALMLQLVDEGLVALDDTVEAVAPELAERHPGLAGLTIERLLGMTSGIPDYMNVPDAAVAAIVDAPDTVWSADELIAFGTSGGIDPPGTAGYSTTNYIVLQQVAESLTGQPIGRLIAERLTGPLGLTHTGLPPNEDTQLPEPFARGYVGRACVQELVDDGAAEVPVGTDTTEWNASYGQAGGGMHSTLADLGTWVASMSGSAFLSDELARTRLETNDIGIGTPYGLGIQRIGPEWGHIGEAIGWEGWVGHDPERDLSVVIFTNACHDLDVIAGVLAALDPDAAASLLGA